ncbi:UPF0182 family protein [Auritidibacter ignavus]|uniref:UPF0182 family membrane protein n=1 Tax=Auritidibacter ignavus TaxID=678932 RepID=UPI003133BC6B
MSFGQSFGDLFSGRSSGSGSSGGSSGNNNSSSGSSGGPGGSSNRQQQNNSRRPSALIITIIILAALVALFVLFAMIYTEVLWFSQLDFTSVFWIEHLTRGVLFVIAGGVMAFVTWLAMWLAWRKRPDADATSMRDGVYQFRKQIESVRRLVFIGVPLLIGFFAGAAAMNSWQQVLLFLNQEPYGETDPEFGLDLTFYMATLPMLGTIVSFATSVVLVAGIVGLVVHYLFGAITIQERGGIQISRTARWHIVIFASLFMLLQGVNYWLDRYRALQNQEGNWAGAMYTDVNAVIPTSTILAVAAVLVIALFILTGLRGRWRFGIIGAAAFIVAALVAGVAYPYLIQQYRVQPTERALESEFIERNINYTREAYGLSDMEYTNYAGETEASAGALAGESATTANIRLMDPNLLSRTFGQLQQFRPYYSFPNTLHVDRYEVDGEVRDTIIAPREVNVNPDSSWVNQHITYTHGYGLTAADSSEVGGGGRPAFLLSGIPTDGELASDQDYEPRIYFGMNSPQYSIVGKEDGDPDQELDRPQDAESEEDTTYTFSGDGGPSVGNIFNRLSYAIRFGSTEIMFSQNVTSNSQILYDRHPVDRVEKVAPYLEVDSNAFPAIVNGRVKWIVDAYTTSDAFPYSDSQDFDSVTVDSLNTNPNTNPSGQVNYIRNSVKATVDAYDGSVDLYAWEPEDPLLQAWQKVYGGHIKPYSDMSAELMDHVRYPSDMFKVQRELLGRYHVTDPDDFYENNDAWSVPVDPTISTNAENNDQQTDAQDVSIPPYYMSMQLPGKEEPAFQLTTPFIPQVTEGAAQRNVLYGFLAANGDAGTGEDGQKAEDYGHLQLLELPRQTTTPGPGQAQANFDSNDTVSQELNLLRQGASDVINGNMITLPAADGILYVQPVYVQSTGETSYPVLRKVLVAFGDEVGFADTLAEALDQIFGGDSGAETSAEGQAGAGDTPPPEAGDEEGTEPSDQPQPPEATSPQQQLDEALQDARDAMQASEEAMADGDWAAYGEAQDQLNDALSRALEAEGVDSDSNADDAEDSDENTAEEDNSEAE